MSSADLTRGNLRDVVDNSEMAIREETVVANNVVNTLILNSRVSVSSSVMSLPLPFPLRSSFISYIPRTRGCVTRSNHRPPPIAIPELVASDPLNRNPFLNVESIR